MSETTDGMFYDIIARYSASSSLSLARPVLAEAQAELAEPEAEIAALVASRERQLARVVALTYAISPLRMVPAKVLTQIFRQFGWSLKDVLRLASVCGYWRQLIVHDPRMWLMRLFFDATDGDPGYAEMVRTLLTRSAPLAVDVALVARKPHAALATAVARAVMACAHRWQEVEINCDILPFLAGSPLTLDALVSANITLPEFSRGPASSLFQSATGLRRLTLNTRDPRLSMPWAHLERLDLKYRTHSTSLGLVSVLGQCASLRNLKMDVAGWRQSSMPPPTLPSDIVTLPLLEDIIMEISAAPNAGITLFSRSPTALHSPG
jgi:hypothetical protein